MRSVLARRLAVLAAVVAALVVAIVFALTPNVGSGKPIAIATDKGRAIPLVGDTGTDWLAIIVIALVSAFVAGALTWLAVRWLQRRRELVE
jgi:hypothetical protein